MTRYEVTRLGPPDRARAKAIFALIAAVFDEPYEELSDAYVDGLLARPDLFVVAASRAEDGALVGGLTAHALPMTRAEVKELFIYDVAVDEAHQRQGVGRLLMRHVQEVSGGPFAGDVFVPADDEDAHAKDFYRALGGAASAVTFFTFPR